MTELATSAVDIFILRMALSAIMILFFINYSVHKNIAWGLILMLWFSGVGSTPYDATDYKDYYEVASLGVGGKNSMERFSWLFYHSLLSFTGNILILQVFSIIVIFAGTLLVLDYLKVRGYVLYSIMSLVPITRFFTLSTDWYLRQGTGFMLSLLAMIFLLKSSELRRRDLIGLAYFLAWMILLVMALFFHSTSLMYFVLFLMFRLRGNVPSSYGLMDRANLSASIFLWLFFSVAIVLLLRLSGILLDFSWLMYALNGRLYSHYADSVYGVGVSIGFSYVIYGLMLVASLWLLRRQGDLHNNKLPLYLNFVLFGVLVICVLLINTIALVDRLLYPFFYVWVVIISFVASRASKGYARILLAFTTFVVIFSNLVWFL